MRRRVSEMSTVAKIRKRKRIHGVFDETLPFVPSVLCNLIEDYCGRIYCRRCNERITDAAWLTAPRAQGHDLYCPGCAEGTLCECCGTLASFYAEGDVLSCRFCNRFVGIGGNACECAAIVWCQCSECICRQCVDKQKFKCSECNTEKPGSSFFTHDASMWCEDAEERVCAECVLDEEEE